MRLSGAMICGRDHNELLNVMQQPEWKNQQGSCPIMTTLTFPSGVLDHVYMLDAEK